MTKVGVHDTSTFWQCFLLITCECTHPTPVTSPHFISSSFIPHRLSLALTAAFTTTVEHWNCFKAKRWGTSERPGWAGLFRVHDYIDTILNRTELTDIQACTCLFLGGVVYTRQRKRHVDAWMSISSVLLHTSFSQIHWVQSWRINSPFFTSWTRQQTQNNPFLQLSCWRWWKGKTNHEKNDRTQRKWYVTAFENWSFV